MSPHLAPAAVQGTPLGGIGDILRSQPRGPQGRRPLRPGPSPGQGGAWPMGRAPALWKSRVEPARLSASDRLGLSCVSASGNRCKGSADAYQPNPDSGHVTLPPASPHQLIEGARVEPVEFFLDQPPHRLVHRSGLRHRVLRLAGQHPATALHRPPICPRPRTATRDRHHTGFLCLPEARLLSCGRTHWMPDRNRENATAAGPRHPATVARGGERSQRQLDCAADDCAPASATPR